jgi:hypothetical protein
VIDLSGYKPSKVQASCDILRDAAEHCTFVSSISVYADAAHPGIVETDAVAEFPDNAPEELDSNSYGALKALCERKVLQEFEGRSAIVRAGLIFGRTTPPSARATGRVGSPRAAKCWRPGVRSVRSSSWMSAISPRGSCISRTRAPRRVQRHRTCRTAHDAGFPRHLPCRRGQRARSSGWTRHFSMEQQVGPYSELPLLVPEELNALRR